MSKELTIEEVLRPYTRLAMINGEQKMVIVYDNAKSAMQEWASLTKGDDEKMLLSFCHFLGYRGYKISGYDDGQLLVVIKKFLDTLPPSPVTIKK